ncbi:phosphoadenylyl-sulfate reductase [Mastigocoleus testarum]|uniref:Adenosine 5'-phosphosulfate reductase n=1 Tax=Mastigocoleus testarum BC008 TaxID=371196 RepID=A0A0V8A1B9_9CYAN|nr:phosphoadenylyl-sulfate reductase [Mastigocoleus testarum]KST65358.1 phosphoadenosine phosphosulfate reductase [Mastigocoleus testarum BC008]KST70422.1 phosphoadenosine phosphosulfate reductase [Mastigocoleus testarum BC008]
MSLADTISIIESDITQLQSEYSQKSPQDILAFALKQFDNITISFSGAEDVVLIDMASKIKRDIQVFSIDTGRLHPETYRFIDRVRKQYRIKIDVISPNTAEVEALVKEKGLFSFYEDGHKECCAIRKVKPLRRKLATIDAWITGQRKDQNPATRNSVPVIQVDTAFSTEEKTLIKFNPLANWTSAQVWEYIRKNNVPYNKLHNQGFISIGCEPCTRAVLPNQHERLGRWWWEEAADKECGFHEINLTQNNA